MTVTKSSVSLTNLTLPIAVPITGELKEVTLASFPLTEQEETNNKGRIAANLYTFFILNNYIKFKESISDLYKILRKNETNFDQFYWNSICRKSKTI